MLGLSAVKRMYIYKLWASDTVASWGDRKRIIQHMHTLGIVCSFNYNGGSENHTIVFIGYTLFLITQSSVMSAVVLFPVPAPYKIKCKLFCVCVCACCMIAYLCDVSVCR